MDDASPKTPPARSADEVLGRLEALAPEIRERAAEAEAGARIPPDLIAKLRAAGVFRLFTPKSRGGIEAPFGEGLKVLQCAARIDGSLGWVVTIGVTGPLMFCRLPRAVFDALYAGGPDLIQAGAAATPGGFAEKAEGGWTAKGRWPFASGCQHADVILGNCALSEGGEPIKDPVTGMPVSKMVVLPAGDFEIEPTWKVSGLKGTGSHHVRLSERLAPDERFFPMAGPTCVDGPLYRERALGSWIPLMHAAFAVGLAEGAIEDLVEMATGGRRQLFARASMMESPVFQYELGRLDADLAASRALLEERVALQWRRALDDAFDMTSMADSMQAGVWITEACLRVASGCYSLGGGAALYETSPLQRRMRDLHAAAQHAVVQRQNYQGLGQGRLGAGSGSGSGH